MEEEDNGAGGDAPGTSVGGGCGDELVVGRRIGDAEGGEREKDDAPAAVDEQLQAPPLDGLVIDSDSAARAERASLAAAGEGGAAAAANANVPASALVDKDDADVDRDADAEACECFVGGLPPDATEEQLLALFEDLNPLSARVNRRRRGGECKGFGFVVFPSRLIAEEACKRRDIKTVRKKKKKIAQSCPRGFLDFSDFVRNRR